LVPRGAYPALCLVLLTTAALSSAYWKNVLVAICEYYIHIRVKTIYLFSNRNGREDTWHPNLVILTSWPPEWYSLIAIFKAIFKPYMYMNYVIVFFL
jgi:hypothetical protein